MAKIVNNDESNATQAFPDNVLLGASQLLLIGFIARFKKNYDRYKPEKTHLIEVPNKRIAVRIASQIVYKQQIFLNLLTTPDEWDEFTVSVSLLVLNQQIFDLLGDLHYNLLDHPINRIVDLVPQLDQQLAFWNPNSINVSNPGKLRIHLTVILQQMITLKNKLILTL